MLGKYLFYILTLILFSYSKPLDDTIVKVFRNSRGNTCGVTEYRYVLAFNQSYSNDSLWNIATKVIDNYCPYRIVESEFDPEGCMADSILYNSGYFLYKYGISFLFTWNYFYTAFVVDRSGRYLCLWSLRTKGSGPFTGSAESKTRRIANKVIKLLNDGQIIEVIEVKPKKEGGRDIK